MMVVGKEGRMRARKASLEEEENQPALGKRRLCLIRKIRNKVSGYNTGQSG